MLPYIAYMDPMGYGYNKHYSNIIINVLLLWLSNGYYNHNVLWTINGYIYIWMGLSGYYNMWFDMV